MDSIFHKPLFIMACFQIVLALPFLAARQIALPVAQLIQSTRKNVATNSVFYTIIIFLFVLMISSWTELGRGKREASMKEVVPTIDYLRAEVSCVLCAFNLLLLLLTRAVADAVCTTDRTAKNLEAMKRQVKGLRSEYDRITAEKNDGGAGHSDQQEVGALKSLVGKLIKEKEGLQANNEAVAQGKHAAEASVQAMKSQLKGFDQEYDRVRMENDQLKRKLVIAGDSNMAREFDNTGKKDK